MPTISERWKWQIHVYQLDKIKVTYTNTNNKNIVNLEVLYTHIMKTTFQILRNKNDL